MIEYEKKILLTKQEYDALVNNIYPNCATVVQTNHYYDNANFEMNKNGITCRIREINKVYSVEVKAHNNDWADCSIENCHCITNSYDDSFFEQLGIEKQGILTTIRNTAILGDIKIMIDKNTYLGHIDYELEIEYVVLSEKQAVEELYNIATNLAQKCIVETPQEFISRIGKGGNKSERFYAIKKHTS